MSPESKGPRHPVDRLLDDLEQMPPRPEGAHLSDEQLRLLATGAIVLPDEEDLEADEHAAQIARHLASCAQCAEDAVNVSLGWESKARTGGGVIPGLFDRSRRLSMTVTPLETLAPAAGFYRSLDERRSVPLERGGTITFMLKDSDGKRILTLDSADATLANTLVICRLEEPGGTTDRAFENRLVLHAALATGRARARSLVNRDAALPAKCVPVIVLVPDAELPLEEVMLSATMAAATAFDDDDRAAVWSWAETHGLPTRIIDALKELVTRRG
jgi:hypothetical protein